ncbi:histidine triad nucleotide-binding protein 2, mitochondrial [Trichonephila clavata]|uniref:Histidine triad nucleotide-binding protein 2, mitochondrial n=1 Tax=Trichonephila clavata TaxID=2740835 RepID=A0A8X6L0G6_TRICU|nr:histidine triad nucleotide-binding protein 2, mitochondrial [Trichonephila clavata]
MGTKLSSSTRCPRDTVFGRILRGELSTTFLYEDDRCVAFRDINPIAPVHILVIPRKPIPTLNDVEDEDESLLGHLLLVAKKVAKQNGLKNGCRIVINNDRASGQTVYHLHVHIIGGRLLNWPPG